jgi:hypothetical protein
MPDMNTIRQQRKQRQAWAESDPVSLVAAAKQALYTELPNGQQGEKATLPVSVSAPLEEIITRFEQQTRASLGTASFTMSQSGQS